MRLFDRSRLMGASVAAVMVAAGLTVGAAPASAAQGELASSALQDLAIKAAASTNGYDRDKFGNGWTDTDGNGCDTRNDTLAHDLVNETFDPGSDCEVATGTLRYEPYLGIKNFKFVADGSYEQGLDTEHIVALGNAWTTGAKGWSKAKRVKFANDPLELMMTNNSENRSKGSDAANEWLPKNTAYRCGYVATQIRIKGEYGLWVTPAEHDAMDAVLDTCPTQRIPASDDPVINPPKNGVTTWAGESSGGGDVARLAGANRYETAATISRKTFPSSTKAVFVATGSEYADALSAGPAAAGVNSPILLTQGSDVPQATIKELQRINPDRIYVLGGTAAVTTKVAHELDAYGGTVTRLNGKNRYETGAVISKKFWNSADVVYLATGPSFADALAGGPLAARKDAPILLSTPGQLPTDVADELQRLDPDKVVLLGGKKALRQAVKEDVADAVPGAQVSRLAGANRYATAEKIAQAGWNSSSEVFLATGKNFPDALAGVPAAAEAGAPLLLAKQNCMPASTANSVDDLGATTKTLLGGSDVLGAGAASNRC